MKRLLALLFALFIAAPVYGEPVTPATFNAALAAAQGGDRIELTAGDYGALDLRDLMFSSDVTIVSADPADPAIIGRLLVKRSAHLVFDGILFDFVNTPEDKSWVTPFSIDASSYITIRNSVFDGDGVAGSEYGTGYGLEVDGSDNIVAENNEFFKFKKTISLGFSTNITIRANDIHSMNVDAITFASIDGLLIEGNWLHDARHDPDDTGHLDMIQAWTKLGEMSARNIIIRGNFFDAGAGDWTQSIFMRNGVVDTGQGSFADYAYQNILIENNVIYNDHIHGITVGETDGLTIRNNTLLYAPYTTAPRGWQPRIIMSEPSVNVAIEGNITEDSVSWSETINHAGWTVGNNILLQYEDPTGENYVGDLFVAPLAEDATLADLRAVAGGVIEVGVIGAAMTRADIPLLVGPYAEALPPPPVDTCEAQLAEALILLGNVGTMLIAVEAELATVTTERDAALAAQAAAEVERDAALAKLDAIRVIVAP